MKNLFKLEKNGVLIKIKSCIQIPVLTILNINENENENLFKLEKMMN